MIRNYIQLTIRSFRKNGIISLINLLGLSIGLASCLVAGLYIKHELTADKFHHDLHAIQRVTLALKGYSINGTPYRFAEAAEKEIAGVTASLRLLDRESVVKIDRENVKHEILFSDPQFLSFFTFPLKFGNAKHALADLKKVVISEEISKKYFADQNPVGQTIQILLHNEFTDFEISGVTATPPTYSSIGFDFIIPLENWYAKDQKEKDDWSMFMLTSFLKVQPDKLEAVEEALPSLAKKYIRQDTNADGEPAMRFVLGSLADHHLREGVFGSGLKQGRSGKTLYLFAGIVAIILLLACFNFMNLTNAQSSRRAVEVGIRKVVGAVKLQLISQFLTEALLLSVFASILALGLAELSILILHDLFDATLTVFSVQHIDIYAGLIVVTLLTGFLAGAYPAFILANINILNTFKRYFKISGSNWITRFILTLQFGASIVLVVCAIVMWRQQIYISNKDLGYNKEQILVVPISPNDTASIDYLKNEIKKFPEAVSVTNTSGVFTRGNSVSIQRMPDNSRMMIYMISIDEDFIPTLSMKMAKGRVFEEGDLRSDNIIINETLMRTLNVEDSIGMKLGRTVGWVNKPTIVGVVKDFHNTELKWEIGPLMFLYKIPLSENFLMVKLAQGQLIAGKEKVEALWEKVNTHSPFEFFFLDDEINKQYASELRWSKIITLATGIAIFLSVLGLLGLVMFSAEQRKKEIGIRKVLGASPGQLITLLSRGYAWLMMIAFVISIPVSYYLMTQYWLTNFAYKTSIDVTVYVIAFVCMLFIAGIAVGGQTLRAARQNPADTLKEE